jgi:hypothetical protein
VPYKDPVRQRAAQLAHVREKRRLALVGRHCERCGTTDELEFHHRDPGEKISHRIWSWSWERIAKELEKCDVLCRPCHDAVHVPTHCERGHELTEANSYVKPSSGRRECRACRRMRRNPKWHEVAA